MFSMKKREKTKSKIVYPIISAIKPMAFSFRPLFKIYSKYLSQIIILFKIFECLTRKYYIHLNSLSKRETENQQTFAALY